MASRKKAIAKVFSLPILSEIIPNKILLNPLVILSTIKASGRAAIPNIMISDPIPYSLAITAILEVIIIPQVAIIDIMKNISQKAPDFNMTIEFTPVLLEFLILLLVTTSEGLLIPATTIRLAII